MPEAHNIYLARTYAYVAAGKSGLVILDIENPEKPRVDQVYTADGRINDLHDVKLGITYVSEFAYLADGKNGMRVVQLTSPETPGNQGFSPRPTPQLVATYTLPHGGHALSVGRASTATGPSTKAATRSASSAASGRGRCRWRSSAGYSCGRARRRCGASVIIRAIRGSLKGTKSRQSNNCT